MPVEHISNQPPPDILDWLLWQRGWVLNLGAGGTLTKLEHCVEMEYSIFRHTDVVGDAHHLPFADACFDAVVTFNTFEHLADPYRAAREIHRVLKPGGRLVLHTAFLQPVHEAPHHYYNTTEYGLRRWFRDFDVDTVTVSENFNPAYVFAWLAHEALQAAEAAHGPEARRRLAASSLDGWAAGWTDQQQRGGPLWGLLGALPQEVQKRFAAGFQLTASKQPRSSRRSPGMRSDTTPFLPAREAGPAGATDPRVPEPAATGAAPDGDSPRSEASTVPDRVGGPRVPSVRSFRVLYVLRPGEYDAACMRYRGYNLIEGLRRLGVEAAHLDELQIPDRLAEALSYDLIVLVRRQYTAHVAMLLRAAERASIPVVCDLDDFVFDEEAIPHTAYLSSQPPDRARRIVALWRDVVDRCPFYTAPTPFLVEWAAAIGRESFLIRNGFNETQLALCNKIMAEAQDGPGRENVRLGYFSGTRTHQEDFRVVAQTLVRLMDEFPNVTLVVAGDFDLEEFPEFAQYGARVEGRPFLDWTLLPTEIGRVDVNLAPLVVNPFTEGKSNLKYYEAGLLKIPTVATPTRVFAESITPGVNGYLAATPDEWYQILRELIVNAELRRQVGEQAYRHALAEYCPAVVADEALSAYRRMLLEHRRRLGAEDEALTVVVAVGELGRALKDCSPALTLAGELRRLGAAVTILVTAADSGLTAAQAAQLLADYSLGTGCAVEVGDAVPCCDLLIAADPAAAGLVGRVAHRACQAVFLTTDYAPLHCPPGADRDQSRRSYELGLRTVTFDNAVAELIDRHHATRAIVLPGWHGASGPGPALGPQPETLLVASCTTLPNRAWNQALAAVRTTLARYPSVRVVFCGPAADRAADLDFPHGILPRLNGDPFEAALADQPLCLALYPSGKPLWVFEMMARGCPVIAVPSEVSVPVAGWELEDGHLTVPAEASALMEAIESLLIDRIRLSSLRIAAIERSRSLPRPADVAQRLLDVLGPLEGVPHRVLPGACADNGLRVAS
jgi:glycosyltransferase involved in cell wall biosynthesis